MANKTSEMAERMKILSYKGISITSKLIRWQTRSEYSHIAIELTSGRVVEAWRKGVCNAKDFSENHTPGTVVDSFEIYGLTELQEKLAADFLYSQYGKKYDFKGVFRFLTRRDQPADDKWFCSELAMAAMQHAGIDLLLRIPASHTSPRDVVISPVLKFIETRTTR